MHIEIYGGINYMKKPIIFLIGTMIFCILLPVLISVLFYGKNEVASSEIAKKITQNYHYISQHQVVRQKTLKKYFQNNTHT